MRMTAILALAAWATSLACAADQPAASSPRHTATGQLVEHCLPSVAAIRCFQLAAPGVHTVRWGSGSVVHPAGYILTNDHVLRQAPVGDAMLPGLAPLPFRIVARLPQEDVALIKIDAGAPLRRMPLGRSHDLMLGEPTIAIGSPDGITHTVSTGIVSGLDHTVAKEHSFLSHLVQTDAAVSGGTSGGPLSNALGQQIGMVSDKRPPAENSNFAIVVDHIRAMFPRMMAAEDRFAPPADNFAVRFTGYVRMPADGLYTSSTSSDDGSRLSIGDRRVVDNDDLHGVRESSGIARLKAGLYLITVEFFQGGGEQGLDVSIEGPNLAKRPLMPDFLFLPRAPAKAG
ncbi:MAG: hypothetical protein FJ284_09120 [Planctomycetes bacterium]|nr:hypothetical protein [Planctomycetota bacterium]